MSKYLLTLFLLLILQNSIQFPNRRYEWECYSFTCNKFSNAVKLLECEHIKVKTSSYLFNLRMKFGKTEGINFVTRFKIDVTPKSKNQTIHFMDESLTGCDDFIIDYELPVIKYLAQEIRRTGNLPFQCLVKEDFLYEVRNFSFTDKQLLPSMPFHNFTAILEFYDSKKLFANIVVTGAIVPKSKNS